MDNVIRLFSDDTIRQAPTLVEEGFSFGRLDPSPRGMLKTAIRQIARYDDLMGETLLGAYRMGLEDERQPADWDEVRLILTTLSGIRALDKVLHPLVGDALSALAAIIADQPPGAA